MPSFTLGHGICSPVIKACVFGSETKSGLLDEVSSAPRVEVDSGSPVRQMFKLTFCAVGLQVSLFYHTHPHILPCLSLHPAVGPMVWSQMKGQDHIQTNHSSTD